MKEEIRLQHRHRQQMVLLLGKLFFMRPVLKFLASVQPDRTHTHTYKLTKTTK